MAYTNHCLIPQLENAVKIAETLNSTIFEKNGRILKLTIDPASYWFFIDGIDNVNPYFPEIYQCYGEVYKQNFKKFFLIEMEKLNPLTQYDIAYKLSSDLINSYQNYWKELANAGAFFWTLPWKMAKTSNYDENLKKALCSISDYAEKCGVMPDLMKPENYMKRNDGHLVIVDPVFSK